MQQILLEVPLLGYVFAPDGTRSAVARFRDWMGRNGRTVAVIGAAALATWLIIRGLIALL